jgi:hypothetical protein
MGDSFLFQKLAGGFKFDYTNSVIEDINGAKYTIYNGYDFATNPTPNLSNLPFNQWLLNNSTGGTPILNNAILTSGGTFNGPNSSVNEASMPFVSNVNTTGIVSSVLINNAFVYAGGRNGDFSAGVFRKYHEGNLVLSATSANYGVYITKSAINNGFIFGAFGNTIRKLFESNLAQSANVVNTSTADFSIIAINNAFVFATGTAASGIVEVRKYHESNLVFNTNSSNYGQSEGRTLAIVNNFVYATASTAPFVITKLHEGNLTNSAVSSNYGSLILASAVNDGFVYVGGYGNGFTTNGVIAKYYQSNLSLVGNTTGLGSYYLSIFISNGFIYASGFGNNTVHKFYESNLTFVGATSINGGYLTDIKINNGSLFTGGGNYILTKYGTNGTIADNQTFYNITKIKEDI